MARAVMVSSHSSGGSGVPGGGTSFVFTQVAPSATWTIVHNLGFVPGGILLRNPDGETIRGSIVSTSATTTVISFSQAVAGTATLS